MTVTSSGGSSKLELGLEEMYVDSALIAPCHLNNFEQSPPFLWATVLHLLESLSGLK